MKTGKNARDIFAPTETAPSAVLTTQPSAAPIDDAPDEAGQEGNGAAPGRGRPVLHLEPATKITTVLLNRHVVYLDGISNQIRGSSGAVVKRSEILRALVEALEAAAPDLTDVRSQNDLTEQLKTRLKA